jgi:membrane protein implicated in regulation of membrane protease activity
MRKVTFSFWLVIAILIVAAIAITFWSAWSFWLFAVLTVLTVALRWVARSEGEHGIGRNAR